MLAQFFLVQIITLLFLRPAGEWVLPFLLFVTIELFKVSVSPKLTGSCLSNGDTAEVPRSSSFSASDCLYYESPVHCTSTFTFVSANSAVLLRRLRVAIFTCLRKTVITDLLMLSDAEYPPLHLTTLI
jgi:hypothetical protein